MSDQSKTDNRLDETTQFQSSDSTTTPVRPGLNLLTGSRPDLSAEIRDVLRERLRMAALLMFTGFLIFLIRRLAVPSQGTLSGITFWSHVGIVGVTGAVALRLCTNCEYLNKHLRIAEFLVFGGSAAFFLVITYYRMLESARHGFVYPIASPWLLLMFTYCFFVPNDWQRALLVVSTIAAAPIAVMAVAYVNSEAVRAVLSQADFQGTFFETSMSLVLAAAIGTFGVRSIRSLRREAFEAKQLGQYKLTELLGSGGMGDVFVGEHTLLKRPCAIKVIRPDQAGDPQVLKRFEREVRSTAKLTHWNTVEIYDYGHTEDGTFYYVMEYLPGLNLQQLVDLHGPLPAARVIHLLAQTCDALSEAHAAGLVHRDLKPANIHASVRGRKYDVAKLLDFGLVRPLHGQDDVAMTQKNTILGSPLFMAPEQASDGSVDVRSDIYSIGGVAYFLLTGQVPFEETTPIKVILAHAQQTPVRPSTIREGIPSDIESIVMRCLEKDPRDRYQDVDTLRQSLLDCSDAGDWTSESARDWWHSHGCPKKKEMDRRVIGSQSTAQRSPEPSLA